jgi:hypothetical protein
MAERVPRPKPGDCEKRAIRRMKDDLEYATKCAKNGEIAWANSYYASIKRKAMKSDFGTELIDGLYALNCAIDRAMAKRYEEFRETKQPTVETVTIYDPRFEEAVETPMTAETGTAVFGEDFPENEERSEKPDYFDWEEAAELFN